MPARTVITKTAAAKAPADRQPKKPTGHAANPLAFDLSDEDEGPIEIPVRFLKDDEHWYIAHPMKGTVAIALGEELETVPRDDLGAMKGALMRFLGLMFSKDQVTDIAARLDDPDDRLDLPHIRRLVNRMSERQANLPTT